MDVYTNLENILDEQELISIPESAREKLSEQLTIYAHLLSELRNENCELNVILEKDQFNFETEIAASRQQLQESTASCTKLKLQIGELEENLDSVQKQWKDLQKIHDSTLLDLQTSKREKELLNQEKRNLSDQLEKRREEIEKLNGDLKNLLEQVNAATKEKFEAIVVSEEAKLKESNLQHRVNRLEQEKELLTRQINDLNAELTQKNSEIHTLKREKSSNCLELKAQLEARADEVHMVQKRLDSFKETMEEKDVRIEALAEKIRHLNETHSREEEQFHLELNAQAKLIELHKNASEDNQRRVQELMGAFEEAQRVLRENNESLEEMDRHRREVEGACRTQLEERQQEINRLSEELRKAKSTSAHGISQDTVEKIFPLAAATSRVLHSGMTLTELYVQHTRLQEELQQQRNENANLNRELKQIISEIEEKTPIINQRMQEYERLTETISCLKNELSTANSDYQKLLEERNDSKRLCNSATRENSRLKTQVSDLNRQVQVLLKEVEEARGRTLKNHRDHHSTSEEAEVTSSDYVTASKVISSHLVTFRDIEEIQLKNQQLLAAIRDLSQQHEEMEQKISSEITSKFEKEISLLTSQLDDLQRKRSKHSEMLETIIRQRDMYRVLLTCQGVSESLLRQPGDSLLSTPSSSLPPDSSQLKEAKTAMNQLETDFTNYKKERAENERMLHEQMDKMRVELSEMRMQNAKLASKNEYSEERLRMLQSNLETYKKEYNSFKEKNRQHSALMVEHQHTINNLRQDLMVAQEKMAKCDVTLENLRAERDLLKGVESRLLQEKESVVREQQHQARMVANLQAVQNNLERIESESKRNLQYQVEKYEKENALLKTRVENAHGEYRDALNVWEKQKKEMQTKMDSEVERSRKAHDELVDAYSQVHALNQEILNLKSQVASEKVTTAPSPSKTPVKTPPVTQVAANVKLLKEQLNEAQSQVKALQDKLALSSKSAEQYLNMCKDLEVRVKEQDEINKHLKDSMESALKSSTDARSSLEKSLENMEKNNRELIEENMKLTQDSNTQASDLQKRVSELLQALEENKGQAEAAKRTAAQAREDCQTQIRMMRDVQEKYERELMLHAQDVQMLSKLKEEHEKCSLEIARVSEGASAAEQNLLESQESWMRQEAILQSEVKATREKITELETCNRTLHQQLELMGTQMAALQSKNWEDSPYSSIQSDLKDTQNLLQVIQFIKKEKEIASTQLDVTQSENVRLTLKIEQLTHELTSVKGELKELMNNAQAKAVSEAQHSDLLKKIEMMNLLSESNVLLRTEKEQISKAKAKLELEYQELQEKFHPLSERVKELQQSVDVLSAERNALRLEVKSWQSRTNQLLEQSHRIGPQEYKNMVRDMEELKAQKGRLAEELQRKQAEMSQCTSNMGALRKEVENGKAEIREKSVEIAKMTEEGEQHKRTVVQIKKIGRKYRDQYDQLKVSYDELKSSHDALQSSSQQEQVMQELQRKVEAAEKAAQELKKLLEQEKEAAVQMKKSSDEAVSKANEKEEKGKKILASVHQRVLQVSNQNKSLKLENTKLSKEIENLKLQLDNLKKTHEKNNLALSQSNTKVSHLEKEKELLQKQNLELSQKVSGMKSQISLGERTSAGGVEPLTANIKPIPSPSTSGTSIRNSPHPHATSSANRPTPTASIRPMAIGTAAATPSTQPRTATVLPTTASTPHSDEDSVSVVTPVPQAAVQPTPATATVAPTTMPVTVSPVISEVPAAMGHEEPVVPSIPHVSSSPAATATAFVLPRIEEPEESPSPTTSVIVSPSAATQTQVVTPTVKRLREDSPPGSSDAKRIRMVSEGSQTNQQQQQTSVVTPTHIAAVLPAAVARTADTVVAEAETTEGTSVPPVETSQPPEEETATEEASLELIPPGDVTTEPVEEDQTIEWEEATEDVKLEEEEFEEEEVMEEEETMDEIDEMQEGRSLDDDEVMTEGQSEDTEEMLEPVVPSDIDILESASDVQMEGDSLQSAPSVQCMAPPPPASEVATPETVIGGTVPRVPPVAPPRLERQAPGTRQHLTPFTIPGQGSNFEEGDDSIVPSTPTLYVPRRTDGFAEAVSSPHVPQVSFLFSGSDSSPTQQGLSQLASQALGMDDTRMDLSQFEDGSRTVPSTPVQVSPPSEASVPDESPVTESEVSCKVPIIKVEAAEETTAHKSETSLVESSEQAEDTKSSEEAATATTETAEESSEVTEPKADTPAQSTSELARKDASPQVRKPIVWQSVEGGGASPSSSSAETLSAPESSSPAPPTVVRGRARARRFRYASASFATRGQSSSSGGDMWSGVAARRGRAGRRRGMF